MQQRHLGGTGQQVSALGLGCMGLVGWYGTRDDDEAAATVARALDMGITHLDTAAVYQDGENERFLGRCIGARRNQVFLATKCGLSRTREGRLQADNHPRTIVQSCDESLQRLGTDHIDLFYLHRIDRQVPLEESMGALQGLVTAGKIRFSGLSEAGPDTLRRASRVAPVAALQSELSLWTRTDCRPALEACRELGIGFVAYSPLGRGFLAGAVRQASDLAADDTRRAFPRFSEENLARNRQVMGPLEAIAARLGVTSAQLALAWVLAQWDGVLPIPGTRRRHHLEANLRAVALHLTPELCAEIEAAIPEEQVSGARYPHTMAGTLNV